jgi:LysR family transcriptional regulator, glycine cleavage system transcriptional activator
MRPLLRRVPQLQRLAVFDAVAATGSFTSAARELGVSQPAVSRHIATIERQLDVALFERVAGRVQLTEHGRRLADGVAGAFTGLERALDDVMAARAALVFAVQPSMATSWIVPGLERLEKVAGSEIRLRIFDRISELDAGEWDLAIVPGHGDWENWVSNMLFSEAVRPLASPGFAADAGLSADTEAAELVHTNLLSIDAVERPSMTWTEWFDAADVTVTPPAPRVVYDTYPTVLQEALVGRGVVLGWRHLVGDLLERGLLVPVGPVVERPEVGHYLCWRRDRSDARLAAICSELCAQLGAASDATV